MNKYLFLYRAPAEPQQPEQSASPEEIQEVLKQWMVWKEKFAQHVVDMGDGLKPEGRVLTAEKVTDGPFIEAKEILSGYSIVHAESYDQALEIARACPITMMPHYRVEIRELAGY